jgi:DNA-binding NtrC family response regulator
VVKKNIRILILEKEVSFRDRLRNLCNDMGKTWVADDMESVWDLLTKRSYQLLLLDWDLIQLDFSAFWPMIDIFQPDARRIALFKSPQLTDVVAAMKAGVNDALWENQDSEILKGRIYDAISLEKPPAIVHSYILQLAESMADQAMTKKTSILKARREFSKTVLSQILRLQKMRHFKLANAMKVSPRTLRRHLLK